MPIRPWCGPWQEQVARYMHVMVYGELVETPQVTYAAKIASLLPGDLESVYFVNSGAEAVEGALKLAKRFTGRTEMISMRRPTTVRPTVR